MNWKDFINEGLNFRHLGLLIFLRNSPKPEPTHEQIAEAIGVDRARIGGLLAKVNEVFGGTVFEMKPNGRPTTILTARGVEIADLSAIFAISVDGLSRGDAGARNLRIAMHDSIDQWFFLPNLNHFAGVPESERLHLYCR